MKRTFWQSLIAVLAGNAIYFAAPGLRFKGPDFRRTWRHQRRWRTCTIGCRAVMLNDALHLWRHWRDFQLLAESLRSEQRQNEGG